MNNFEAIDYANRDWTEDNDFCISRKASEYPRLSNKMTNLLSYNKPWGNIQDPVLIDPFDDPALMNKYLKKGVWYYGGIPGTDHLDYCGLPDYIAPLRKMIGIEFRYDFWRTTFMRIRMLKFE